MDGMIVFMWLEEAMLMDTGFSCLHATNISFFFGSMQRMSRNVYLDLK